jgi:CBS domain-containing protein
MTLFTDKELVTIITETIFKNINNNQIFFAYLGVMRWKSTSAKLLGSFSRKDGEHKDEFDIKDEG